MDTTLADPLIGKLLDGRYRVESRIARGGMATVYLALDVRLDRTVAVKVMHRSLAEDPSFVRRFIGEAKSVASLSHPNVVQVFDQGADGDLVFLSMEYVPGRTLRDVLRERGRLPGREALEIVIPVLAALGHAHQAGMVHRDVKPENVLLTDDGRVKVVDFGLARAIESTNHQTRTGMMIGTVGYMAPEQVTTGAADARSDVYAAGIMLFELLTGRVPYTGETPMAVAYRHVHDTVPPPSSLVPDVPPPLDALVATATARDPATRPADAAALLVAAVDVHRTLPPAPGGATGPSAATAAWASGTARLGSFPPPGGHTLIHQQADLPTGPAPGQVPPAARVRIRPRYVWLIASMAVVMIAAVSLTGWWFAQGRMIQVPELSAKNIQIAKAEAEKRGFIVQIGEPENDDKVAEGIVLKTIPASGSEVATGSTITLIASAGPVQIAVPNVVGMSADAARAKIAEVGLSVGGTKKLASDSVDRGLVLRTSPQTGRKVKEGAKVDLVVSAGLLMPNVRGVPKDQAVQFLQDQGLQVKEVVEQDDDAEPGTVIAQEPKANAEINAGAEVRLTVSRSRGFVWPWEQNNNNVDEEPPGDFVVIPNVLFKSVDDAQRELQNSGFRVEVRKFRGGTGRVRAQRPFGIEAPVGTVVVIWH